MKPFTREFAELRRKRDRLRARPLLHLVPNLFTILGLGAGLTGMRYALDGRWELAVALIGAAIVFDGLDGRSARLLRITSPLGAQLDSLADFVSFGVAPAVIVYLWTLNGVRGVGWALAMLFATCCALRLARFNVELDDPHRPRWSFHFFTGIPAPAAAGLALLPMIAWFATGGAWARSWLLNAAMVTFVAVMMVSRVPTFSIKRLRVPPDYVVLVLVLAALLVVFLVTEPWATLSFIGFAYLLSIPTAAVVARQMRLAEEQANAAGTTAREPAPPASPPGPEGGKPFAQTDRSAAPDPRVVPLDHRQPRR
jgi:CDP-diacylglycerol--serine O-phosphatidyltransferase